MGMIDYLEGFVGENLNLLAGVEDAWQPTDFLPDLTADDWTERLSAFREVAAQVSDELLVVLVGNMVTEEALPNYSVSLDRAIPHEDDSPWAKWLRGWTAEENRHGDLLNTYLRLTGRVDMRAVEVTVHHLIRNGFNPRTRGNDYAGLIYAAFQERATRVSHNNVARLALAEGEENLARICRRIAGDESRHETFYTRVVAKIMEDDPEQAILAYRSVIKGIVAMPGRLMTDGEDPNLFDHFANVTQRIGVYTAIDYAKIIGHLNEAWGLGSRSVTGKAVGAQDYLCRQPERYAYLAEQASALAVEPPPSAFSWINDRRV